MFNDQTGRDPSRHPPQGPCPRCGAALQVAMHLPERIGQPAYDIYRCVDCGFLAWVPLDPRR